MFHHLHLPQVHQTHFLQVFHHYHSQNLREDDFQGGVCQASDGLLFNDGSWKWKQPILISCVG
jgi:hypothetical protein